MALKKPASKQSSSVCSPSPSSRLGGCSQGSKERSRGGDAEWGALLAAGKVYRDVDLNMTFMQIAFYLDCEYRKGTQISQAEKPELLNIITGAEARDVQGSESKEGVSGFV